MLAVQHAPRMGSSQPPSDAFMPFGYSFDPNQDPPINDPPEPAPGAPLLTDTDNRFLSDFFNNIDADHYSVPSFGEGLNFSDTWLDLPPQFMGSSTSFGQQPGSSLGEPSAQGLSHGLNEFHGMTPLGSSMMPPPPHPPSHLQHQTEHRHTPDDVLNAAATLLQNGPNQRQSSNGIDTSLQRHPIGPPVGHLRHQPIEEFQEEHRRSVAASEQEHYPDWMMVPHEKRQHRAPPAEYQWGSDANFNRIQGYATNSEKETTQSLTKEQLKVLECLEPSKSADNTRPSSPLQTKAPLPHSRLAELTKGQDADTPPRKRRKSRNSKDVPDEETQEAGTPKPVRRRKPKAERVGSITSAVADEAVGGKRRKSAATNSKVARENLSEEQKRENHIKSEQKRRTLIKEGFDDLCELVPGLRGGGFSKSTMLAMAAEWLEDLLKGNEALAAQLAALEGRT
ncbi:bhlh family transcription factor [Fusarium austroafricanum]|uniref:Bhlh family transcription factor n=1 Tax=Fusarium austroafricanum TaxID=2364996 RepID=A0A8H4KKQ6_9HYPO|nr:bhlh family transcription factor [Fusarium austroafricanum]